MKKTLVMMVMMLFAITISAQNETTVAKKCDKTCQVEKKCCKKACDKEAKKCAKACDKDAKKCAKACCDKAKKCDKAQACKKECKK